MKKLLLCIVLLSLVILPIRNVSAQTLAERVSGRLLLQVEQGGNIWYVYPENKQRYSITFANALAVFENLALGISNADLAQIPKNSDTYSSAMGNRLHGRLLLQVEGGGNIWYVDMDGRRWSVTWQNLMPLFEGLALGITDADLARISTGEIERLTVDDSIPVGSSAITEIDAGSSDESAVTEESHLGTVDEEIVGDTSGSAGTDSSIIDESEVIVGDLGDFRTSTVETDISATTGKATQYYCNYDETRNKVTIIIKDGGIYDNAETETIFENYFSTVADHLDINNVGVAKFAGSTTNELDAFIEDLVVDQLVGYVILVGSDLPIIVESSSYSMIDFDSIDDNFSFVGRQKTSANQCVDVAISTVLAPLNYDNIAKNNFVRQTFAKFITYHSNTGGTLDRFTDKTLIISDSFDRDPVDYTEEDKYFFYDPMYFAHTEREAIRDAYGYSPTMLTYFGHGSSGSLSLGMSDYEFTFVGDFLTWSSTHGNQPFLFSNISVACQMALIERNFEGEYSWPQAMMQAGIWNHFQISGTPYHHSFERWFETEKVFGKALRKTFHNQAIVFGDILAVNPY
jgi:hypothetical protein